MNNVRCSSAKSNICYKLCKETISAGVVRWGTFKCPGGVCSTVGYDLGGVLTSSKREPEQTKRISGGKEPHCLYPGDLYPFTRKPLFVVVDSDNSFVFQQIPRYFGQPLMVLMSPQDTPPALRDIRHGGSLFTLFLHAPLAAFCLICNIGSLALHHWDRCQSYIDRFLVEASRLVLRSRCGAFSNDDIRDIVVLGFQFGHQVLDMITFQTPIITKS